MKFLPVFFALLLLLSPVSVDAKSLDVQEVVSPGGIKALLVQDEKLPLIAMQFSFRGGVEQDPAEKQGLASMAVALLTEGAGNYDSLAFQQRLADNAISLGFGAGRDQLSGSMKTLAENKAEAFKLLHLALTEPKLDADAIQRVRSQQLTQIQFQLGDPSWQARYALLSNIFPNHPYSQRGLGTAATVQAITRDDIVAFIQDHLAQDNLIIGVAGKITPAELARVLDDVFGGLPKQAKLKPVPDVTWPEPTSIRVDRAGTQTELLFTMPSLKRDDPDWYAASIVNYILGGGGFASRLMGAVRDKAGLTYGISTTLNPMEHAAMLMGSVTTENDKIGKAWKLIEDTWLELYETEPTEKDIAAAKAYLAGELPLRLTSTTAIAGYLVGLQQDGLPADYLDLHADFYNKVTKADISRVTQRWFNPDGIFVSAIGQPADFDADKTFKQVTQ